MTIQTLTEAQEYLTIAYEDRKRRIVDLRNLIRIHPPEVIVSLLKDLLEEKKNALRVAISGDKTRPEINEIVATMFRVYMAVKAIEEEVNKANDLKQGAGRSSQFQGGNCSSDRSSRFGKDANHDGEDRETGQGPRSAA